MKRRGEIKRGREEVKRGEENTHTHTHSCHFATAAFKAVMTGQRVIRD